MDFVPDFCNGAVKHAGWFQDAATAISGSFAGWIATCLFQTQSGWKTSEVHDAGRAAFHKPV